MAALQRDQCGVESASEGQLGKFYAGIFQAMTIQARDGATREELEAIARLAMKVWP